MVIEYTFKGKLMKDGYLSVPAEIMKRLQKEHIDLVDVILRLDTKGSESTKASDAFWSSFGSWEDDRTADEIIEEIHRCRKSSRDIVL